ncbi:MAG TPA: SDR family oxidoreductase [Acidimicrobiales bacterium]|jgi:meso-butanediol dehydrogenase/(S,S)-butanediol dehydrogenase/diacetyl reductase
MSTAVVTGGGRGLGRGIALALAADGFDLVLGYRGGQQPADATAGEVRALGRRAETVRGDVADPGTAKLLVDAAAELGTLRAWVNNAGVSLLAPVVDTAPADFARMLDVNVTGTLHGTQAAAKAFLAAGRGGRIVNVASDLGVQAGPNLGGYAATKFAVVGLTQAAALELAAAGITVNAVCPGTAETDMVLAERDSEVRLTRSSADEVRNRYLSAVPAGRFCTPEDVGALVSWLCSPAASYLTGQSICTNGGSILH